MSAGYGKINPYLGLRYILDKNNISTPYSIDNVTVFPTIGNGLFNVICDPSECLLTLHIYNVTGSLLASYNLKDRNTHTHMQFSIPTENRGIYYIQVTTDKGQYTYKYVNQ